MSSVKAKAVNVDPFIKLKVKKAEMIAYENAPQSLNKGAVAFSQTAARVMPPPRDGRKGLKIDDKLYYRQIHDIKKIIKDPSYKKLYGQFRAMLSKGMNFVVFGYKDRGKRRARWYAPTRHIAKTRIARIKYRGLYKWLWGSQFDKIGEKTPSAFKKLLQKSPDLIKVKDLADMKIEKSVDKVSLISQYFAQGIDYFAKLAEQKALKSSLNKMKSFLQKKIKKEIKDV